MSLCLVRMTRSNFGAYEKAILDVERAAFSSPWSLGAFWSEVESPVSQFWVLCKGEGVAGYICFWVVADEIHLLNLAVAPFQRRAGIGKRLLDKMVEVGRQERIGVVFLEVRPSNLPARALYQKEGFQELGRRPGYYEDNGEDAVIMALYLT